MKKVYLHPDFADCDRIHIDTCAFRAYSSHELEGIHNSFIRGDLISDQFRISKGVSCEMYLQSGLRRGFSRHVSNLRAEREVSDVSLRAITNYFIGHDLVLPDSTTHKSYFPFFEKFEHNDALSIADIEILYDSVKAAAHGLDVLVATKDRNLIASGTQIAQNYRRGKVQFTNELPFLFP